MQYFRAGGRCVTLGFLGCGCVGVSHRRRRKATGVGVVELVDKGFQRGWKGSFWWHFQVVWLVAVSILVCVVP